MSALDRQLLTTLSLGLAASTAAAALDVTGVLPGARFWLAGLVAVAMVVMSARSAWAATGRWAALAVIGALAALELIQAGTPIRYQHALDWPQLAGRPVALAVLGGQALLVAAGWATGGRLRRLGGGVGTAFGWARLAVFGLATVMLSATLNRDVAAYVREVVTGSVLALLQAATIGLAALAAPARASFTERAEDRGPALGRVEWTAAVAVVVACLALNEWVYQNHPHVPDEVA